MRKIIDRAVTVLNLAVTLALFLLTGYEVGQFSDLAVPEAGAGLSLLLLGAGYLAILLFYLLLVILHEAGHLICGILTGWKFVSFRVGSLTLVRREGRYLMRRANLPGTAGQCLLEPPDGGFEHCPFGLYHLGGGLMNLLIGGLLCCFLPIANPAAACTLRGFAFLSFAFGANNLIPMKLKGMTNDGYLLIELRNNARSREANYLLLKAYAALIRVKTYGELPGELVERVSRYECHDLSSVSETNVLSYRADFAFYRGDYADARAVSERIAESAETLEIFKNEARAKLLYFRLMDGASPEEIDAVYDKKLREYLAKVPDLPSTRRLMFAVELLHKKDKEAAEKEYAALLKTAETAVCCAEAYAEIEEAKRVRARAEEQHDCTKKKEENENEMQ